MVIMDSLSLLGGVNLDTTRSLLVQAILTLDEAHNSQPSQSSTPSSPSLPPSFLRNIKTALDRLSKLHILLFSPPSPQEEQQDLSQWLSENRDSFQQFLGNRSNSDIDEFLAQESSCGVLSKSKTDSPPESCDTTIQAYQPAFQLQQELKIFRQLAEQRFAEISGGNGVPRVVVEKVAEVEELYFLTRDQTTDCVWNVEYQALPNEVFLESDSGKMFRQKCQCPAAEEGKEIEHSKDVYCPKNKKDEDCESCFMIDVGSGS
jgi:dsDNA-binding SOS-regulon protein